VIRHAVTAPRGGRHGRDPQAPASARAGSDPTGETIRDTVAAATSPSLRSTWTRN